MTRIAVIDFDGTIVEHGYPDIGDPLPNAFEVLKELQDNGWKLILWTCREDEKRAYLQEAVDFCKENGVEFDAVNETILQHEFRSEDSPKRKPYGHVHIDDRNFGGFPGWDVVKRVLVDGEPF